MRYYTRRSAVLIGLGCLVSAGCASTTEPVVSIPSALVGTWAADTLRLMPRGLTARTLKVEPSGRFQWTVRTSGLYSGQALDDLTSMSRVVGQMTTEGTRLVFQSDSVYTSNSSNPMEVAEKAVAERGFGWGAALFDQGTYAVENDVLAVSYVSYPNDAPAPTSIRFVRVK